MEECPVCPKKHPAAFMEKHLKTKHNIDSRKFKCEFCHKMFTRQGHLNRHRKIHTGNEQRKTYKNLSMQREMHLPPYLKINMAMITAEITLKLISYNQAVDITGHINTNLLYCFIF